MKNSLERLEFPMSDIMELVEKEVKVHKAKENWDQAARWQTLLRKLESAYYDMIELRGPIERRRK